MPLRDMVGELEGNYSNHVKSYLEGLNPEIKANSESYMAVRTMPAM